MVFEAGIVKRAKAGDEKAFEQLVTTYERKVYTLAYRYTGNEQDALDIAQEVFIRVYKSLPGFKEQSSFSTWIYRVTSNICIDHARKRKAPVVPLTGTDESGEEYTLEIPDTENSPERVLEGKELREEIMTSLSEMDEGSRQVILLRDIGGLSYAEISEVLTLAEGTVKSRLARAREKLRRILITKGTIAVSSRLKSEENG